MIKNFYISAIILAAGNSSRMGLGSGESKVFLKILGKPCIYYTLLAFSECKFLDEIIIVCKEEHKEKIKELAAELKINCRTVSGGNSRQQSVINGVKATNPKSDFLVIHDAARCLITKDLIEKVIKDATEKNMCSILGVPVKDTIKVVKDGNLVEKTLKRDSLFMVQTPQVLKKGLYLNSIEKAIKDGKDFTDDSQLIESYTKEKVHVTLGEYSNVKLTTKSDIPIVENILKAKSKATVECMAK